MSAQRSRPFSMPALFIGISHFFIKHTLAQSAPSATVAGEIQATSTLTLKQLGKVDCPRNVRRSRLTSNAATVQTGGDIVAGEPRFAYA